MSNKQSNSNSSNNNSNNKRVTKDVYQKKEVVQSTTTTQDKKENVIIDKEKEIREFEKKKSVENRGVEESESLIKNSLGHLEKQADLAKYWVDKEQIRFMPFLPSDNSHVDNTQADEVMLILNTDVSKLLKLKYNVFWSHIFYNPSVLEFLDSFLRYFNRAGYKQINLFQQQHDDGSGKEKQQQQGDGKDFIDSKRVLAKRVFSVIVRMSMQQEKTGDYLSRPYYARAIIQNRLFDVPKIIDICSLFAWQSKTVVVDLVQRLFDVQPALYDQFSATVIPSIVQSLITLNQSIIQHNSIDLVKIEEAIRFIQDTMYSLDAFLRVHPMATHFFATNSLFMPLLVYYYERVLPLLQSLVVKETKKPSTSVATDYTSAIQHNILGILCSIIKHLHIVKIDQITHNLFEPCQLCDTKRPTIDQVSSNLVDVLTSFTNYPIPDQNKQSKSISTQLESINSPSILLSLDKHFNISSRLNQLFSLTQKNEESINYLLLIMEKVLEKKSSIQTNKKPEKKSNEDKSTSTPLINEKDKENIQNVKDIFPDFGDGFIFHCLKHFGNVESTINSLLEDNLPLSLKSLDRSLKDIQSINNNTNNKSPPIVNTSSTYKPIELKTTNTNNNNNVYEMTVGKKRVDTTSNQEANRNYILMRSSYEATYDDEYDDSLDAFTGVSVNDGESLDTEDQESSKRQPAYDPFTIQKSGGQKGVPRGGAGPTKSSHHQHKNHNRKDQANKKRGMMNN